VLCENNMHILKLLSEEVFEVKDQMTQAKTKALKERLNEEFAQIFTLCDMVLQQSTRPSLLNATLQTLQRFLVWVRKRWAPSEAGGVWDSGGYGQKALADE